MSYVSAATVLVGVAVVVAACLACAGAVEAARRSGNWLWLVCAVGSAALIAGIVGQRTFPSDGAVAALGQDAAAQLRIGPWDAGVSIPGVHLKVTPVALGGFLTAMAGLSLILFLEPSQRAVEPPIAVRRRRLEDDDLV